MNEGVPWPVVGVIGEEKIVHVLAEEFFDGEGTIRGSHDIYCCRQEGSVVKQQANRGRVEVTGGKGRGRIRTEAKGGGKANDTHHGRKLSCGREGRVDGIEDAEGPGVIALEFVGCATLRTLECVVHACRILLCGFDPL